MRTATGELIERGAMLEIVEVEIAHGLAGDGRLVLVEGEAGVGKTRVLDAAASGHPEALVLNAAAGQYEGDLAFGVARQLLGSDALAAYAPVPLDVDVGAVLHDLHQRVLAIAAERPLLIVVDDLHWADPPSVRLLAYLARRLGGAPVALLAGARTGAGDLAALREPALGARALVLEPLSADGSALLLSHLLGDSRARPLADACHRATGGNPFLLQTMARSLEEGDSAVGDGTDPPALGASATVESWVRAQLDALGGDATVVLETIAVTGEDVPLATVAALAGLDPTAAAGALDDLVATGLLRPDGRGFAHPLVHAAVREGMPIGRRAVVTGRAARFLAAEQGDIARAAALLQGLPPTGEGWAATLLREAGELAMREGAPAEAAALWRRCLEEPASTRERFETMLALGTLECARGEATGLERLERAHSLAPDPSASARAALARGRVLQLQGRLDAKISLLEAELDRLGTADSESAQEIEGELALLAVSASSVRARTLPRLRELQGRVLGGGESINPVALAAVAAELGLTGRTEDGLRCAREARERLGDEAGAGGTGPIISSILLIMEAWPEVEDHYDAVIADPRRSLFLAADALAGRGMLRLLRGDVVGAAEAAREALGLLDVHIVQPLKLAVLADALVERDRILEALEVTEGVAAPPHGAADGTLEQMLRGARVRALHAAGRHREAVECGFAARDFERAWAAVNPHLARWREPTALSLAASGREEEARALAVESLELARTTAMPTAIATARRTVALLEPGGADVAELRSVATALEGEFDRLERARTLVHLGAALRAAGEVEEARTELAAARELAHACGSERLERLAREELLASGARPRRIAVSGRAALTPAEERVAELAAGGLANPAIAAELVISRRTVEMHLSNAYRKLGIDSRRALPDALR